VWKAIVAHINGSDSERLKSMSVNVIASVSVSRTVPTDVAKFSELWGDVGKRCSGISKMLVVAIDRSDYEDASAQLVNVYGIDPAHTSEFVFQAVISPEALSAFLKRVADCDAHPPCQRWVAADTTTTDAAPMVVIIPNGDPPTTGPKAQALSAYADAAANNETTLTKALAAAAADVKAQAIAKAAEVVKAGGAAAASESGKRAS